MSLYHVVFIWLFVMTVVEHVRKGTNRYVIWGTYLFLTVMLCIRFGQGQDYFSYACIYYYEIPNSFEKLLSSPGRIEIGWQVLGILCKKLSMSFPVFVAVISVYMMAIMYRFLQLYCKQREMLALMLCYHTLYLTYFMSILRQAVVVATFLGILLPWLLKRKYILYFMGVVLLYTFHEMSACLIILPFVMIIRFKDKTMIGMVAGGYVLGFILYLAEFGPTLYQYLPITYLNELGLSPVAIMERVATFAVVTVCYLTYRQRMGKEQDISVAVLYKIYAVGVFLYGCVMWSVLIASRVTYPFKVIEIALLCKCIPACGKLWKFKIDKLALLFCLALTAVMYVKNIDSYLEQAPYYRNTTLWNYPYITVFDQEEVMVYRDKDMYLSRYPFRAPLPKK